MHYKKTDKGWVLEPYNQYNKAHFIKRLKDGLAAADDIVIRKKACNLTRDMGVRLLDRGYKQIPSSHPEYEAYEDKRSIPENPYIHYLRYIRKGENPIIISQSHYRRKRNGIRKIIIVLAYLSVSMICQFMFIRFLSKSSR